MKKVFNLSDYEGNFAMHCKTKAEAESFCEVLHENGRKWHTKDLYVDADLWHVFKEGTVYYFNQGLLGNRKCASSEYTVLEWSDFFYV